MHSTRKSNNKMEANENVYSTIQEEEKGKGKTVMEKTKVKREADRWKKSRAYVCVSFVHTMGQR